ncbi:MAG: pyridoxamine 5-phosphate oxidase [Marmoricola sp.]|nr:pyridoxamine 5-phosphate oxidase [Marmoricola sp.]
MTTGQIDPRYGNASAVPPPWHEIDQLLIDAQLYWVITVRADGRPHAVPLVGVWHDGAFAFCTGKEEQKVRNLEANPQAAVTTGGTDANGWASGKDVVVEGTATRVTDDAELQALAGAWLAKYGEDWNYQVRGTQFFERGNTGGSSGTGAWVYRVTPAKVLAFGDSHGQTAYRF